MYERKDYYFKKAKTQGFRARSSFKLLEIQKKYSLIKKNSDVLDIGCSPGSWIQVIKKISHGKIVGVDLTSMQKIEGVIFIKGDIRDEKVLKQLGEFDVVISDIAPKTSGIKERDQYLSFRLSLQSLEVARKVLRSKGNFLVKTFQSPETDDLFREVQKDFKMAKRYIPKSTRSGSKELYIIGINYKG